MRPEGPKIEAEGREWGGVLGRGSSYLVLLFWSWSWSCKQRSWSCYFGLGLKNLVLFTSLPDPLGGDLGVWQ